MPTNIDVVTTARTYLGVPWRHQGRSRLGLDCAGLVVLIGRELELSDHDRTGYSRHAQGLGFVDAFREAMDSVPLASMRLGDVLLFADEAYPCHCGILSEARGTPHFLHAHAPRRKVMEEPLSAEWRQKLRFAFRFRGLED
ncbi:MAG: NlpC/P60 family protein [Burkholderiales bacterium]